MPKQTFHSLDDEKRNRIKSAFLLEFSLNSYDDASISNVVRKLGISKGSIYQYFEDKLDVFNYLIAESVKVKVAYVGRTKREDFPDFWSYFKALYEYGYSFDRVHPMESHFLHNLTQNLNSPSVKGVYDQMLLQTVGGFKQMIQSEIELGLFRSDLSVDTMAFLLYKVGLSIMEQLELENTINPQESIKKGKPVFEGVEDRLLEMVDDYVNLVKPAFNKR